MRDDRMKEKSDKKKTKCSPKIFPGVLADREVQLIRRQIRGNSLAIDRCIEVIDLLINKERCPKDANTLAYLRKRLEIAIAENDTFRRVLWQHAQLAESRGSMDGTSDAASFLLNQIRSRRQALIAQMAMK